MRGRGRGSRDMSQSVSSRSPAGEGAVCMERDEAQLHNHRRSATLIQTHMLSSLLKPFERVTQNGHILRNSNYKMSKLAYYS